MEPTSSHHRAHLRPHAPQSHCAPLRARAQIISLPARHSSTRFQQARALHHSHVRQSQLSLLCALNPHLLHRCNSPFRMQHADNSPPRRLVCNSFPASDWTPVSIALTTIALHCARRVGSSRCAFRIGTLQRDVHVRILLNSQVAQCIAPLWVLCRTLTTVGTRLVVSAFSHCGLISREDGYCAVVGIAWIWMMASD